ncbi:MAG: DUF1824 family protein [Microcystis aeruginosa]
MLSAQIPKLIDSEPWLTNKIAQSPEEEEALRQAILLVNQGSESINLGICADNDEEGFKALKSYLKALGYTLPNSLPEDQPELGAVYIKYNTQRQASYLDSYTGTYRGVLISCQSENDQLVGTYGHFPLDLFS